MPFWGANLCRNPMQGYQGGEGSKSSGRNRRLRWLVGGAHWQAVGAYSWVEWAYSRVGGVYSGAGGMCSGAREAHWWAGAANSRVVEATKS